MSKKYIVNKVGGGIMVPALLPLVKNELQKQIKTGHSPVVVVSAVKDVTDTLISFLATLSKNKKTKSSNHAIENFIEHLKGMHLKLFEAIEVSATTQTRIGTSIDKIMISLGMVLLLQYQIYQLPQIMQVQLVPAELVGLTM